MIMLDDTTALVFDTNDLRDAVNSDNGVDHVYFGANITLAYGITIFPGKPSLVFDGTHEGVTYTFTDMDRSTEADTIGIRSISNITITFQNINLVGRNFFGIPFVPNNAAYNNISTIYHKVNYIGTQMTHNPYGLARYTDCNITVNNNEVAEVSRVEIGGVTTIVKTNTANSVFWFYGTGTRRPYLKILSGADVTITTAHYFMYENNAPDYIIEQDANFTLNTNSGISYTLSHTVNSFLVDKNAVFRYTQSANRGYATLSIDGALTVNEGADFYMQADFANIAALIRFTGSSARLNINNARSFALYNRGNALATAFLFVGTIPFVFIGNQVNYWESPKTFPEAGTFDDIPKHKWNRPSWSQFRMDGRAGNLQTYVDNHDFTQEELEQMPALTDLILHKAIVFSVGNLPLSVNRIVTGSKRITGKTTKKAKVRALCIAAWTCPDCEADGSGLFYAAATDPVPSAEMFTITSNTPFLLTTLAAESQEEGGISIIEAPEFIQFVPPPLAGFANIILRRQTSDAPVTVRDERAERTEWVIWAKISGPLQTEENDVLDNAVVFASEEGDLITLGTEYAAVYTDGPYLEIDDVPITWEENKGVLARITVPIRSGRRYTTRLDWVVYPEGIQPEGGD